MQTIAIDIDDVLSDSVPAIIAFSNQHWGTHLTRADYNDDWMGMWGISRDETYARADQMNSYEFRTGLAVKPGAKQAVEQLKSAYKLVLVTSRRSQLKEATYDWVDKHFAGMFEAVHFAGMWDVRSDRSKSATKTGVCMRIGAQYLIDDQPKHCIDAANHGICAILFGDYPWNELRTEPSGVKRAYEWAEVREHFKRIRAQ